MRTPPPQPKARHPGAGRNIRLHHARRNLARQPISGDASHDTAIRAARTLRAGTVSVNAYSEGDITTPFGGFKESGFGGRDKCLEAFDHTPRREMVWISVKPRRAESGSGRRSGHRFEEGRHRQRSGEHNEERKN